VLDAVPNYIAKQNGRIGWMWLNSKNPNITGVCRGLQSVEAPMSTNIDK
jgi:hypothetical protein